MVVLDTYVALWLLAGERRLTESPAYRYVEDASHRGTLRIASITLFELAQLHRSGVVRFDVPLAEVLTTLVETPGLRIAPLDEAVAAESVLLDAPGDPFPGGSTDRIICATTRALRGALVTAKPELIGFGSTGALRLITVD